MAFCNLFLGPYEGVSTKRLHADKGPNCSIAPTQSAGTASRFLPASCWSQRSIDDVALLFCRVRLTGRKPKDKAYPTEIKTIGDAIRKKRLDLGLNQKEVAKIIGCNAASVLNWEKGYNEPTINKMSGIVRFSGVDYRHRFKVSGAPSGISGQALQPSS
jgi:DNA-binding XRE family transcriptional regulator